MDKKETKNKALYLHDIEYDTSHLPSYLQEQIKNLEKYDEEDDWISYDMLFYALEGQLKNYLLNKRISEYDFKIIMRKYGRYVD